jgi:quinolinate synthase
MNRIDLPHLVWAMETILGGRVVNEIRVNEEVAKFSRIALDRMLALPNL